MMTERTVAGLRCSEVLAKLSDYLDGEASDSDRSQIDAHLAGCDWCERFGGEFAGAVNALRRLVGEDITVEMSSRLRERLGR